MRNRRVLRESVSKRVYHFTFLPMALKMCREDAFFMQTSLHGDGSADYRGNKFFYACFTRNKNTGMGYAAHYQDFTSGVRFELDGDLLNNNYKGFPIDYYADADHSSVGAMYAPGNNMTYREKQQNKRFESEDRIVSDSPVIDDFHRYVTRVDIFLNPEDTNEMKYAAQIKRYYGDLVHIYDNQKDFNYQTDNEIGLGNPDQPVEQDEDNSELFGSILSRFLLAYYYGAKLGLDDTTTFYGSEIMKDLQRFDLSQYFSTVVNYIAVNGRRFNGSSTCKEIGKMLTQAQRYTNREFVSILRLIKSKLVESGCRTWKEFITLIKENMMSYYQTPWRPLDGYDPTPHKKN